MAIDQAQARALRGVGKAFMSGLKFAVSSTLEGFDAVRSAGKPSGGGSRGGSGYISPEMVKLPKTRSTRSRSRGANYSLGTSMPMGVGLTPEMRRRLNEEARQAGKQPRW